MEEIRGTLKEKGCEALVLRLIALPVLLTIIIFTIPSALDDVAWLLNLRGSDIYFNPVFFSYAAVTEKEVLLETINLDL